jgi:uncharacterized protein (UPF0332 family)
VNRERERLVRHRLERSRAALAVGERLLSTSDYLDAVNRFYYAAFHAARALLAAAAVRSTGHKSAIVMFQKHFVKTGRIDPDTAKALPRAFQLRQAADYEDFPTVAIEHAHATHAEVLAFVERCERVVAEMIATEPDGDGDQV